MSLHKLTAGDGYLYLVRQVAAADTTERGRASLADYYSAKGESPGRWLGNGLTALKDPGRYPIDPARANELWPVPANSTVTEAQMAALFGEGLHPNADAITAYLTARGAAARVAVDATRLGRRFRIPDGETPYVRALATAYRAHNAAAGNKWNAPIDPPTRAAIRTTVARSEFARQYGRAPADERELSGFIARNTRARATAVAGYDLTFSPVKSVSALWAVAPEAIAHQIDNAHDAAVADVLDYLDHNAAFTRTGTNGVAQVDTRGLIAATFTHRDSRAGEPDLHTHVAISNKVATTGPDGVTRWLALDGQPLHRHAVVASELYNTRLEAHLHNRLGIRFADATPPRHGRRPVREVVGIPRHLLVRWSSRRAAIEARTAELSKHFQARHGREPSTIEAIALAQQATLESREAKHEPRSAAEQRAAWRAEAVEVLGHHGLTAMLAATLSAHRHHTVAPTQEWIAAQAARVIDTVAAARATWQRHHVLAEAQRVVRVRGHAANSTLAEAITEAALAEPLSIPLAHTRDDERGEPEPLRRRDGASVYCRHGTATYTSAKTLAAERRIVAAATRPGGRTAGKHDVDLALADAAARGRPLNPGQAALVTDMATSGRRVALALAPAGTGKTTAMAALSHAWRASGGSVVGLAPTAAAAIELGADLAAPTDTVAKYVHLAHTAPQPKPHWFTTIDHKTLIILDEAGKAGTCDLDAVIGDALAKGASVRLVGDDGQLASISAGGVLRDIAARTDALTLSQLVRFTSAAEGAASLALRAGDPAGIGYYIDHHRVHVGADATAADMAYTAWRADLAAGRDSLLLAPTNDTVDALNARARLDRISAENDAPTTEVVLADQLRACAGDLVRARRNARWLPIGRTDFVRNGYRFTIDEVLADGALRVRHHGSGQAVVLPARYVAAHVTLGYAATIDNAQGVTAQHRCHVIGGDRLTRQLLYVALTRGRAENHIYLSTAETDPHRILFPKATHPDTAVDVLTRALARDNAQTSALTAQRDAGDPFTRLRTAADMYHDALGAAAEHHLALRIGPGGGHPTRIGPLHWLPAIPAPLRDDPQWGPYLARRQRLVAELADQIRTTTREWTTATAPAWAKPVLTADAALAAEIAVFRAAVGVHPEDSRLLGAPQHPARTRAVQKLLETHAAKAIGRGSADARRWHALIDAIDPRIRADGYWPQLADHLAEAGRSRPDLAWLVKTAAVQAPLPDELPAAALWWRLAAELSPATAGPDPTATDAEAEGDRVRTELRVLELAGRYNPARPLRIPAADPALAALAELPFTITPVRATRGPTATQALQMLRTTANAADRKVLWCSPTTSRADQAHRDGLADTATTLTEAHRRIRDGAWQLPPGALIVVDDAATAQPTVIADLAEHAAATSAGLILIDSAMRRGPGGPSTHLLTLLRTELPWATSLAADPADAQPTPPNLDPVLTRVAQPNTDLLTEETRDALRRRDRIRAVNTAAHERHLTATRMRDRGLESGIEPDSGIGI